MRRARWWLVGIGVLALVASARAQNPPTGLAAIDTPNDAGGSISLSWNPPADTTGITDYRIYRQVNGGGPFVQIGSVPLGTNAYMDATALLGTNWDYEVRSWNGLLESVGNPQVFNVASINNTPSPPQNLTVLDKAPDNGGSLNLSWQAPGASQPFSNYRVYRRPNAGGPYVLLTTVSAATVTYTDAAATLGTAFDYTVRTYNSTGALESANSNEVLNQQSVDNIAPQPPSAIGAADTPSDAGGSITVTWTVSSDDTGGANDVVSYRVHRSLVNPGAPPVGGVVIATVPAGTASYADATTTDATNYWYWVTALDTVNESSAPLAAGPAQSRNNSPPAAPTSLTATDVPADEGGVVDLTWVLSADDGAGQNIVTGYAIYRRLTGAASWSLVTQVAAGVAAHQDNAAPKLAEVEYTVRARNQTVESADSNVVTIVAADNTAPAAPTAVAGVNVTPDNGGSIGVSWTKSADDGVGGDVTEYRVYRATVPGGFVDPLLTVAAGVEFAYDNTTVDGVDYYYVVGAWDGTFETRSAQIGPLRSGDEVAPAPARDLTATDFAGDEGGKISLAWTLSTDDGGGTADVATYKIHRSDVDPSVSGTPGVLLGDVLAGVSAYTDATAANDTDYWYTVVANDGTNDSVHSNAAGPVRAYDDSAPEPPTDLVVGTAAGADRIMYVVLQWTLSEDDAPGGDVVQYHLYRATSADGFAEILVTLPADTSTYEDHTILPSRDYYYMIKADDGTQLSEPSEVAGPVQTTDSLSPVPPTNVETESAPSGVILTWTASVSDDAYGYNVYRADGQTQNYARINDQPVTDTTYTDSGLVGGRTYWYRISTIDQASPANESGLTVPVSGIALDATAPDRPRGLRAVGYDTEVALNWEANTESDLAGYHVYRRALGEADFARLNASLLTQTSYIDYDVVNGSQYEYYVTAVDDSELVNESAESAHVVATPDEVHRLYLSAGTYMMTFPRTGLAPRPAEALTLTTTDYSFARWWPPGLGAFYHITSQAGFDSTAGFNPPDCQGSTPTVPAPPAGLGYFLRLGDTTELVDRGAPISTDQLYPIRLQGGWNMIGNPFESSVGWAEVTTQPANAVQEVAWGYDQSRGYFPVLAVPTTGASTALEVNRGYWVLAEQDCVMYVPGPTYSGASMGAKVRASALDDGVEWMVPLYARSEETGDSANYVGVASAGATSPLARGIEEPPAIGDHIALYFPAEDGRRMATHFGAGDRSGLSTEFVVETSGVEGTVTLGSDDLRALPREYTATLVDLQTGDRRSLRAGGVLTFTADPDAPERRFRLEIGKAAGAAVITGLTAQPLARGAEVRFRLNTESETTIVLLNAAGRVVRTVESGAPRAAGEQSLHLDGRSDRGSALPSGIYRLRVEAVVDQGPRATALTTVMF